jgi:hypothetical protein
MLFLGPRSFSIPVSRAIRLTLFFRNALSSIGIRFLDVYERECLLRRILYALAFKFGGLL